MGRSAAGAEGDGAWEGGNPSPMGKGLGGGTALPRKFFVFLLKIPYFEAF